MLVRFRGVLALAILLPWSVAAQGLGQAHRHATDADHEAHSVVHRHLSAHAAESHDHGEGRLAADEDQVVWLDEAVLHQTEYRLSLTLSSPVAAFLVVRRQEPHDRLPLEFAAPAHGPPRAAAVLRGPPSLSS